MPDSTGELLAKGERARRERRYDDARDAMQTAINQLRVAGRPAELADALRKLGELERRLDSSAASAAYREAIAILRKQESPVELAHALRHLGDVLMEAGRSQEAEPCYNEALQLYRAHGHDVPGHVANAIRSVAVFKEETGSTDEAVSFWSEAHDIYQKLNIVPGVAECAIHLAFLTHKSDESTSLKWLGVAREASKGDADALQYLREVEAKMNV